MNRDQLYFHFANLVLAIIGLLSIQKAVGPFVIILLVLGSIGGFMFSWHIRNSRPPHIDTFIGMLSLASVVVVLSRLYETSISFDNILTIFSTALAWLSLFQTFGLKAQKSYAIVQFISVCLLISSVSLALEQETAYVLYLAVFLFVLIFIMRLDLVCGKQSKGSLIIGDRDEVMSLWQQIKVGAIMFSIVMILSAIVYPAVPRFNSLSLSWIPATLLGLPERIPLLKLLEFADKNIKEANVKKGQIVDDGSKKRETNQDRIERKEQVEKKEVTERFKAPDFDKDIDVLKIESVIIKSRKSEIALDKQVMLTAELKLTDGSFILATKLVDWKATGTAKVSIDKDGKLTPKEQGRVQISATYMGNFSNDLNIKIIEPVKPKKKKGVLFYSGVLALWIFAAGFIAFSVMIFMRSQKLSEIRKNNPKEFIKEIYYTLCKAFKIYGIPKFDHVSYREFYNLTKDIVSARPEPMQELTEGFMEARFSSHEISQEHSQKAIQLFHEVKDVILEKEDRNRFWKSILFRFYVLDVLLIPKQ
jgi:TgpA N-terminal domain